MANVTVTFTITEFCLYTGVSEEELHEIVGLGVIEPHEDETFDDHALTVMRRAVRLRQELELDWPGIAVALTLLEEGNSVTRGKPPAAPAPVSLYQPSLVCQDQHGAGPFIIRPALLMTLPSRWHTF